MLDNVKQFIFEKHCNVQFRILLHKAAQGIHQLQDRERFRSQQLDGSARSLARRLQIKFDLFEFGDQTPAALVIFTANSGERDMLGSAVEQTNSKRILDRAW